MWTRVIHCYWRLSLLKESPANTPYSPLIMLLAATAFLLLILVQWSLVEFKPAFPTHLAIFAALSLVFSYTIYTFVLLKIRGLSTRLVQTMTCLWMAHFIIHLFALPLLLLTPYLVAAKENPLVLLVGMVYLFITLGLSIWQFVITAHIYRLALNVSTIQSLLASIGLLALNILTVSFWR